MGLFDVHAHLTDPRLAAIEGEVLARAQAAGITTIVSNGLNPGDNQAVAELAARSPLVRPAFGLYPVDAVLPELLALGIPYEHRGLEPVAAEVAVAWLRQHLPDAVALGEIGLDRHWVPEPLWERQEAVFRDLIRLGLALDKPIILHSRRAEARALQILQEEGARRVDWHCFSSKIKLGRRIAEHGHWLSIPANAARIDGFRRLLEILPRDKILLETDCPYLSPVRGELNEPASVARTVSLAASLWGCGEGAAVDQLEENFEALFGFAP
ncbi:MAG TPA: TatD family deoxyribonuclease [Deltaproteobacteria bacterium]|nr:TatD family deoxyribonuclease [Deltaproteobacteria bacterium]